MKKILELCLFMLSFMQGQAQENQKIRLGMPLGHTEKVTYAEYNSVLKILATIDDKTIKIWDALSGKLLHNLSGQHINPIRSLDFSNDGSLFVTASDYLVDITKTINGEFGYDSNNVKIWDAARAKLLYSFNSKYLSFYSKPIICINSRKQILVATAIWDGTVEIWDATCGKLLCKIKNYKRDSTPMTTMKFSNDGLKLFITYFDGTSQIWDVLNGNLLNSFGGGSIQIFSGNFSSDGKMLLTVSSDSTAKIWDTRNGQLLNTFKDHNSWVSTAEFSIDDKYIVTSSGDETAKIWQTDNAKLLLTLSGHDLPLLNAVFSDDSQEVLTTSGDGTACTWEASSGRMIHRFYFGIDYLEKGSAHFISDSRNVLTFSWDYDQIAKVWDNNNGKVLFDFEFNGNTNGINSSIFTSDGRRILALSEDSSIRIWCSTSGKLLYKLKHNDKVNSAHLSPNEKLIVSATADNYIKIWDLDSGKGLHDLKAYSGGLGCIFAQFSPDSKKILACHYNGTPEMWDVEIGKLIYNFPKELPKFSDNLSKGKFSSDGKLVCTYNASTYKLNTWATSSGEKKLTYEIFGWPIENFFFSRDNKRLIIITETQIQIIDALNGKLRKSFNLRSWQRRKSSHWTNAMKYSNISVDGKLLFTGTRYGVAKIWDAEKLKVRATILRAHNGPVSMGIFSNDGKILFTASLDSTSKIWDTESGRLLFILEHDASVNSAVFSSDDNHLLTSSDDGSFCIWDVTNGKKLIQQFVLDGEEYIALAANGLFDATPGAMKQMYWIKGDEIIDFEQLKERYWEPGLWEKVMNGEKLRDVKGMNQLRSAPEIFLGEIKEGKLPIQLKKRDGGYGKVSIQINGKEVEADVRGGQDLDSSKSEHQLLYSVHDSPLLKPGEENTITVFAWSEDGFVQGRGVSLDYTPNGEENTTPPSFYAVICGVSEYSRADINLRFAEPDAKAVATAIQLGAEALFGKDKTHIYTLTSPGSVRPTKDNIRSVFKEISKVAKREDVFMLYLSGHGITWGGEKGDFYYLTADAFSSASDAYSDPIIRNKATISTMEFTEWIKEIPLLKQVVVIDACGSGKAVDNLLAMRNVDGSQIIAIDRMKNRTGMFVISGCAADAVSYEASRYGQGLLTYSILQGMKGAAIKNDKVVDVETLFTYAREQVPVMAQGIGGIQTPQLLMPKGGSIDIGILDAENRKKIPLASPKPIFVRSTFFNIDESEDNLNLSAYLDEQLNNLVSKGPQAELIFVDARDYPNGCKVSGSYSKLGNQFILNGKMKCGEKATEFKLEAENETELKSKLRFWVLSNVK